MGSRRTQQTAAAVIILGQCLLRCLCGAQQPECSQLEYGRCIRMADPLLRDPDYVFPDNVRDIGRVCSMWGQFVSCVQRYTQKCFSESRQVAFDKAVQDTKESMRQMCQVSQYQTEYLKHASCMKSMLTKDENCGKHYQHLVRQVYGEVVTHSTLCCSHHIFRECMIAEVKAGCDHGDESGQASRFTRHTLDKALSFMREQCYSYVPSSGECPGLGLTPTGRSEDARGSTFGMDHFANHQPGPSGDGAGSPWTTRGEDRRVTSGMETGAAAPGSRRGSSAPSPWSTTESNRGASTGRDNTWTSSSRGMPSLSEGTDDFSPWYPRQTDTAAGSSHHNPSVSYPDSTTPLSSPDSNPYSVSRASTFGRGMLWTPSTSSWASATGSSWTPTTSTWNPPTNSWTSASSSWTSASNPWTPSTSTWTPPADSWTPSTSTWTPPADSWTSSSKSWKPPTSSRDAWTPASTWRITSAGSGGASSHPYSTESWFPSGGNTVDEPNQQGLTINGAAREHVLGLLMLAALAAAARALC